MRRQLIDDQVRMCHNVQQAAEPPPLKEEIEQQQDKEHCGVQHTQPVMMMQEVV